MISHKIARILNGDPCYHDSWHDIVGFAKLVADGLLPKSAGLKLGDHVRKKSGSEWQGYIVGTYSTKLTPNGFCVESENHSGSVQIYPESALELIENEPIVGAYPSNKEWIFERASRIDSFKSWNFYKDLKSKEEGLFDLHNIHREGHVFRVYNNKTGEVII
jgi:hypothetical protein